MVFKCQEDSFLKEFTSKVVSCEETRDPIVEYGKESKFEGYQIVLENTILFPAGGGQPHDRGWLNDTEVLQVVRKGDEALHFTREPMEVGTEVVLKINWERRFDHMQQHSGQHLLSAILEKEFKVPTTSWWLGSDESFVELHSTSMTAEIINKAERRCNELIRMALPVEVKFCRSDDPSLDEAHTRGLPKDCMDIIRVICIGDIDENMCCGTHVTNLSQLQMIKIVRSEPGKKGKTNIFFLVGDRITKTFQRMLDREKALTLVLKNEPSKHEDLVRKMQNNLKTVNKNLQNVLLDLAQFEVERIKNMDPKPKYIFMNKKEATPEHYRAISKGLEDEELFMFFSSQDFAKPHERQIIVQGPHTPHLIQKITDILKAKGAYKNGRYQGKSGEVSREEKCRKLIEEYFNNLP